MTAQVFGSDRATVRRSHVRRGWPLWLAAHARAWALDLNLAAGAPPWQSALYAARARQLTAERSRRGLARGLEGLVEDAERPRRQVTAAVAPCAQQVREARPLLLEAATRLRGSAPVDARGVARLRVLLCDGSGPCFIDGPPGALATAVAAALEALELS